VYANCTLTRNLHRKVYTVVSTCSVRVGEANVAHIAEHGVSPEEAEEVFADPRRRSLPAYNTPVERRSAVIGEAAGRVLVVVYTRRGRRTRVVTARDATAAERRKYRRT
jgi:uncharacterized protein